MNWNVRRGPFARKGTKYRLRGHRSSSAVVQAALFGSEREITAQYGNAPVGEGQFKLFTQVYLWSSLYRKGGLGRDTGENARARMRCLEGESHPVGRGSTGRPIGMTGEEAADETDPVTDKESES